MDKEIVIAGALLHDIGKLESYRMAPVPEITVEGALLDHVAQGYLRFSELAAQFGLSEKLRTHLSHILLSHHGQREFGSPVVPRDARGAHRLLGGRARLQDVLLEDSVKNLTDEQPISAWNNSTQRRFWKK